MISNPIIEDLEECLEDGDYSTVSSKTLRAAIETMKQADVVINQMDQYLGKSE